MMKIKCIKNGIESEPYDSIVAAAEAYNVNESSIRRVLDKPGRTSCELEWITCEAKEDRFEEEEMVEEKFGEEERKPKFNDLGTSYIVYYGKKQSHNVRIEKTKLQEMMDLFCVAKLTINSCTYKLGLTRREFTAIKTAFDITHDSVPLLSEDIDRMSADEITEAIRLKKKSFAIRQFEQQKYKDQSRELDKFNKNDYWFKLMLDKLNTIDPEPWGINKKTYPNQKKETIIYLADIHAGLTVDSPWNKYGLPIMRRRFQTLARKILATIPPCRLHIAEMGDSVHGLIHGSVRKQSEDVITSTHAVTECIGSLLTTLMANGYDIVFTKVNGSHSSIEKAKDNRTDEENLGRTILWALQYKLGSMPNIKFIEPINNTAMIPIFGYNILCAHGDQTSMLRMTDVRAMFPQEPILEVCCGHVHHHKVEDFDGVTVIYNECFCGTDQYAAGKFLNSQRGVRWAEYDAIGRTKEGLIRI